jgi:pimeloyl-ACP methyl ester carboxylesterase
MSALDLADASIYYEVHAPVEQATHRPLILIAGLASDSQSWLPRVVRALSQQRLVVTLDNRGCGRTEYQGEISIEQMASDCLTLADHLDLASVDLLGHSMGGMIALTAARQRPHQVNRMVLCNSSAKQSARNRRLFDDWSQTYSEQGPTAAWYRNLFYWLLTPDFFEDRHALDELVHMVMAYPHAPSATDYRLQGQAVATFDALAWLHDVQTPTLVMAASDDLLFPPGKDASGLAALPNVEVNLLSGQSHSMPMLAPDVLIESVSQFLNQP